MAKTYSTKQNAINSIANDAEVVGTPTLLNDNTADNVKDYTFNIYYADQKKREVTLYVYDEGGPNEKAWFGVSLTRNERARTVIEREIDKLVGQSLLGGVVEKYERPTVDNENNFGRGVLYIRVNDTVVPKEIFIKRDGATVEVKEYIK